LVETGLAVRATSEWRPRVYPGLFTIQAQATRGIPLDRLEASIDSVLERLVKKGPTPLEMRDARTRIRRGAALAYEGASRTGFRLGYFATLRAPAYEDHLLSQLLAVRAEEVMERARELFQTDSRVVVRYEPTVGAADE